MPANSKIHPIAWVGTISCLLTGATRCQGTGYLLLVSCCFRNTEAANLRYIFGSVWEGISCPDSLPCIHSILLAVGKRKQLMVEGEILQNGTELEVANKEEEEMAGEGHKEGRSIVGRNEKLFMAFLWQTEWREMRGSLRVIYSFLKQVMIGVPKWEGSWAVGRHQPSELHLDYQEFNRPHISKFTLIDLQNRRGIVYACALRPVLICAHICLPFLAKQLWYN